MCRERVAQAGAVRAQPPQRAGVEPSAPRGQEQRVLGAAREFRPRLMEVARQPVRSLLTQRHGPLLPALAVDVDELLFEVDVSEIEIDRLAAPEARRVDELAERAVSQPERTVAFESRKLGVDRVRLRRVRQPSRPAWTDRTLWHAIRS